MLDSYNHENKILSYDGILREFLNKNFLPKHIFEIWPIFKDFGLQSFTLFK
jgi:hypothetical protein